jgi:hypothetical protein
MFHPRPNFQEVKQKLVKSGIDWILAMKQWEVCRKIVTNAVVLAAPVSRILKKLLDSWQFLVEAAQGLMRIISKSSSGILLCQSLWTAGAIVSAEFCRSLSKITSIICFESEYWHWLQILPSADQCCPHCFHLLRSLLDSLVLLVTQSQNQIL